MQHCAVDVTHTFVTPSAVYVVPGSVGLDDSFTPPFGYPGFTVVVLYGYLPLVTVGWLLPAPARLPVGRLPHYYRSGCLIPGFWLPVLHIVSISGYIAVHSVCATVTLFTTTGLVVTVGCPDLHFGPRSSCALHIWLRL